MTRIFSSMQLAGVLLIGQVLSLEPLTSEECGKSRACWTGPPGCSADQCHMLIRWRFERNKFILEMQVKRVTNGGEWFALGFSDDQSMGNDTVFACVFNVGDEGSESSAHISYNQRTNNIELEEATAKMLKNKQFRSGPETNTCAFQVDFNKWNDIKDKDKVFKLDSNEWWNLLFAQGPANPTSGKKSFHEVILKAEQLVKICEKCGDKLVDVEK